MPPKDVKFSGDTRTGKGGVVKDWIVPPIVIPVVLAISIAIVAIVRALG